jgi:two-component system, OmpR family, sensor histidine kinase BaeS
MRLRLILAFVLVVLVSIASVVLVMWRTTTREVDSFMFRGGMVGVDSLADALEEYYRVNGSWDGVSVYFQDANQPGRRMNPRAGMGMMMNQRLRLYDADGSILVDTRDPLPSGTLTGAQRDRAIRLTSGRRTVGYLLLEEGMAFTLRDQENLMLRLNRAALTAALIGGALSLLLAGLVTYQLARPIQRLKEGAERLSAGDLSQRVVIHGGDEMASLGLAFNQMAASLQKVEENRRSMTADIAHELRTPLSIQRAHLEALQDGIYTLNPENLEPVIAQNLLLTRLVEDLRTLALAEAGQLTLDRTVLDLDLLTRRLADRFRPQASFSQVEIVYLEPPTPPPAVSADPARIEQILGNLLTNALRHTSPGGRIDINVWTNQHTVNISVHDSGPGIPEQALPRIFERFYRADPSRSREEGGSGLGLAIARQLARAHGGDLTAANHPAGGAVFTLALPKTSR